MDEKSARELRYGMESFGESLQTGMLFLAIGAAVAALALSCGDDASSGCSVRVKSTPTQEVANDAR